MESVKDSLAQDNNVYLRGFGSFIVKKRAKKQQEIFLRILL
jgi:DNA-binding protein HU-beta